MKDQDIRYTCEQEEGSEKKGLNRNKVDSRNSNIRRKRSKPNGFMLSFRCLLFYYFEIESVLMDLYRFNEDFEIVGS